VFTILIREDGQAARTSAYACERYETVQAADGSTTITLFLEGRQSDLSVAGGQTAYIMNKFGNTLNTIRSRKVG